MKILNIILFLVTTAVFGQKTVKENKTAITSIDSLKTPLIDMEAYSIQIPLSWEIAADCAENQCTAISPSDTIGGFDTYLESINLTVNKLSSSSYTSEKYANYSIDYLPKVVKEFRLLNQSKTSPTSYRIVYTGIKNNLRQVWRQYYHVKNSKVYIVTFSSEQRKYKYYRNEIMPYLKSFKFK